MRNITKTAKTQL